MSLYLALRVAVPDTVISVPKTHPVLAAAVPCRVRQPVCRVMQPVRVCAVRQSQCEFVVGQSASGDEVCAIATSVYTNLTLLIC